MRVLLRGGRADGTRVTVPDGTTELSIPALNSMGSDSSEIYRPSGECFDDLEVWEHVESPWTQTGPAPLL